MASFNIELNSNPKKGTDEHGLLLRITVNRKHARHKLDYSIQPKYFNPNPKHNKYIKGSHPKAAKINRHIDDKIQQAKDALDELTKEKKYITAEVIKNKLAKSVATDFYKYTEGFISEMHRNNEVATAKRYDVVLNKIMNYKGNNELAIESIDVDFLKGFEEQLLTLDNTQSTIHANMRVVRALLNRAVKDSIIKYDENPFLHYRLKNGKPVKERLNLEEIALIENLELKPAILMWHVKNSFLFSYYCAGIRVSDLLMLKWKNIINGRLVYKMYKTKMDHSVKLWEKPAFILDHYKENEEPDKFIFPFFDSNLDYSDATFLHNQISAKTALINKYLKKIATLAEIDKRITTHTARHSFADIARQKTNNLYNLSKTLGHSSLKITEAYLASFDDKAVDDTLDEVFK